MHPVLDHIVLLVPHSALESVPAWLTGAFTVLNGGTHADGLTANKLLVFRDGTYIELIAFVEGVDPAKRAAHRWGRRPEGRIIDWALGLQDPANPNAGEPELAFQQVKERVRAADAGVAYGDPVRGGRTTPAGTVLKWAVATPVFRDGPPDAAGKGGGELPFWCLDRTPRSWRVPHEDPGNATHPSRVTGVAGVTVVFRERGLLQRVARVYDAIHQYDSADGPAREGDSGTEWQFRVPVPDEKSGRTWTLGLRLASVPEDASLRPSVPDVFVKLAFVTEGPSATIRGEIIPGLELEFDLIGN